MNIGNQDLRYEGSSDGIRIFASLLSLAAILFAILFISCICYNLIIDREQNHDNAIQKITETVIAHEEYVLNKQIAHEEYKIKKLNEHEIKINKMLIDQKRDIYEKELIRQREQQAKTDRMHMMNIDPDFVLKSEKMGLHPLEYANQVLGSQSDRHSLDTLSIRIQADCFRRKYCK